jgi:ABC-type transport system substrate-binding protein
MDSYWNKVLSRRIKRRRALVATGGATAAAAFIAACGGDDDDDGGGTGSTVSTGSTGSNGGGAVTTDPGLLSPVEPDSNIQRGGTLRASVNFEPRDFDPQNFPNYFQSVQTFGLLVGLDYGVGEYPSSGTVIPNNTQSWEFADGGTTLTMKMHPGAHFAPLEPVNGRAIDAEDVVFSWDRLVQAGNQAVDFANELNPGASILSVEAPDKQTVVIKLNQPNAVILSLLARQTPGSFYLLPKEAADESVLDITKKPIGTGFMYLSEFEPSVRMVLKRNPGFQNFDGDLPYLDAIELPLISETAQGLAQLAAGNLHTFGVPAEEILPMKARVPDLALTPTEWVTSNLRIGFGTAEGSPFIDERVRQAYMLSIDRELYTDTQYNISKFADQGIALDMALESGLAATMLTGWFLNAYTNPEAYGENAKFFKQDFAEAKKLLAAAGYPDSVDTTITWVQRSSAFSVGHWYNGVDIVLGMLDESGLWNYEPNILTNYFAEYIVPYHHKVPGVDYDGAAFSVSTLPTDPAIYLFQYYNKQGGVRQSTDDTLDGLTSRALAEFDEEKRKQLVQEIQVYEAGTNFFPRMGAAKTLNVSWPALRNWGVYQGGAGLGGYSASPFDARLFIDPSKPGA